MTKASEVTVSEAEVAALTDMIPVQASDNQVRKALAALLAPRLAAERERCAKVADDLAFADPPLSSHGQATRISAAIRALGDE